MDKRVIFAVAGSGKTTYIIDKLRLDKRALIITYTKNNIINLREGIINKFGYFPDNITLLPYFSFLYTFCFKPFLSYRIKAKGIFWDQPPSFTARLKRDNIKFYMSSDGRLYHNRISKLLEFCKVIVDVNERLCTYYDDLFIDEIQDLAGNDFNLLKEITKANIEITLVGDFFQHTFDTSRDGNTNNSIHKDYRKYLNLFTLMGLTVDTETLGKSWRCNPGVCDFITKNIGVDIDSHRTDDVNVCVIDNKDDAGLIFRNDSIVKLFYQESSKYDCYSRNWGECKGENCYGDVCVVLNKRSNDFFNKNKLKELAPSTRNKLYVACSRAKKDLYIVSDKFYKEYKKNSFV